MQNESRYSRREEYSEATRRALLVTARRLFTEQGFHATGIEAIARATRVTRGALYHHFADKRALFDAVVVELQAEMADTVAAAARAEPDLWARLDVGIEAFFDAAVAPDYRRLVLQEGIAVLGVPRFREIDQAHSLAMLDANLLALRQAGELDFDNVALLSRLIVAMTCEIAMALAEAGDAAALRADARQAVRRILAAFRRR
jgi:AcrR family transcriptional regulator